MQLLFLLLLLVGPYLLLGLANRRAARFYIAAATRARVGLSLFFAFTALGHFIKTQDMSLMIPPFVPFRIELIYLTGILEVAGAVGVWVPRLRRRTGFCLILMLLGLLPANLYSALHRVPFGGHEAGPVYLLVRVPFQVFAIWWTYLATEQPGFRRQRKAARLSHGLSPPSSAPQREAIRSDDGDGTREPEVPTMRV